MITNLKKLIFITHPSVVINPDIPIDKWILSESGIEQLLRLIKLDLFNDIDYLYSSNEPKAIQVAQMVSEKYSLEYPEEHKLICLNEINHRIFIPPEKFKEATKLWFDNPTQNINGWESRNDTSQRIVNCVKSIMDKSAGNVAIIGHGGTGTLLKCYIKQVAPSQQEDQPSQGSYFLADWSKMQLISDWIKY